MRSRFADDIGSCSISGGKYVMNSSGDTRQSVLSGVRIGGAYVVQVDQTWRTGLPAGLIVNYQDPENFGVVMLEPGALGGQAKVTYAEFKNGEKRASRASGSYCSKQQGGCDARTGPSAAPTPAVGRRH